MAMVFRCSALINDVTYCSNSVKYKELYKCTYMLKKCNKQLSYAELHTSDTDYIQGTFLRNDQSIYCTNSHKRMHLPVNVLRSLTVFHTRHLTSTHGQPVVHSWCALSDIGLHFTSMIYPAHVVPSRTCSPLPHV